MVLLWTAHKACSITWFTRHSKTQIYIVTTHTIFREVRFKEELKKKAQFPVFQLYREYVTLYSWSFAFSFETFTCHFVSSDENEVSKTPSHQIIGKYNCFLCFWPKNLSSYYSSMGSFLSRFFFFFFLTLKTWKPLWSHNLPNCDSEVSKRAVFKICWDYIEIEIAAHVRLFLKHFYKAFHERDKFMW